MEAGSRFAGRRRQASRKAEPARSPVIWNNLVFLKCDTRDDSFLLALDAGAGKTVWKTERDESPSWGAPALPVDVMYARSAQSLFAI
jgi:outer membrane protein assembly factor BamB